MRIIYTPLQALLPPIPYFLRRPRSLTRRRRSCYHTWKVGFTQEKALAKGRQKGKVKKKYEGVNEQEQDLEGVNVQEQDLEGVKEEEIDLNILARVGDSACRRALESMTKGMTREQLLGFMDSLDGEWCGCSERRKVVVAADVVKVFPVNWKIEIAVRRRGGSSSLHCRSYVSPSGIKFKSCKDAAVYLRDQSLIDVATPFQEGEMRQISNASHMFLKSMNKVTGSSTLHEANNNLLSGINDLYDVKIASRIDCFPCGLTFDDMDGLKKHLVIFHKKTTRKFELPKQPHNLDKAQMDPGQHASVDHDEPGLGKASSSSQKIAEAEEPVAIVNGNDNGRFRTKCTWCNKEFLCEPVDAETMADATGFMCPECKEKLCGVLERSLSKSYKQ